mmetsp:Transcript_20126/g.17825  ORF Transcript_20126/g.17825 Transcript_20126/m.17825 type:complete len:87 (+) Transcript_20126:743-1003(+)
MSTDHKPNSQKEANRIVKNGGSVYQTQTNSSSPRYGPHRILPGRLSVSRAFGDIEAKLPSLGGNPDVLIAIPEIKTFQITKQTDFL